MMHSQARLGRGNRIEPTVVIEGDVRLGDENYIGHFAVLVGPLTLGSGNQIGHHAVLTGPMTIGDGNRIGPHATLGTEAQHNIMRFEMNPRSLVEHVIVVGDRNVLREYVTVHRPTEAATTIGDDCYLMAYVHIPHDATLQQGVILANNVQIGGGTWIGMRANVGLSAVIHQQSSIGAYAMIGMGTVVNRDVPPFVMAAGDPVRIVGLNRVGLRRSGFTAADLSSARVALRSMPPKGMLPTVDGLTERVAEASAAFAKQSHRFRVPYANAGRGAASAPSDASF